MTAIKPMTDAEYEALSATIRDEAARYNAEVKTIFKKPVYRKVNGGVRIKVGFPVCEASSFVCVGAATQIARAIDFAERFGEDERATALSLLAMVDDMRRRLSIYERFSTFKPGDRVRKKSGSQWQGEICGFYATELTREGYCVESEMHANSVQIYPVTALEPVPPPMEWSDGAYEQAAARGSQGRREMIANANVVCAALSEVARRMDDPGYRVDDHGVEQAAIREAVMLIEALEREKGRIVSTTSRAIDAENTVNRLSCELRDTARRLADVCVERDNKTVELSQRRDRIDELLHNNSELRDRAMKAERELAALKAAKPDYYWLADDGETGCDDPVEIMGDLDRLEPCELMTSFNGPTLWCVGYDDIGDDGALKAKTFASLEEAQRFCAEQHEARAKIEAAEESAAAE